QGVLEVTLLGQNVNAYRGRMGSGDEIADLATLVSYVAEIPGIERIRFTTSHPKEMTPALIAAFGNVDKLVPHLHLPVQSGSDRVLAAMKRGYTVLEYKSIVRRLRDARPGLSLTTDLIVGFPGESDADFEQTMKLVADVTFDGAYSFAYSARPGTPAAQLAGHAGRRLRQADDARRGCALRGRLQLCLQCPTGHARRATRRSGRPRGATSPPPAAVDAARCAVPHFRRRDGRHAPARARHRPCRKERARACRPHRKQPRRQLRGRCDADRPLRRRHHYRLARALVARRAGFRITTALTELELVSDPIVSSPRATPFREVFDVPHLTTTRYPLCSRRPCRGGTCPLRLRERSARSVEHGGGRRRHGRRRGRDGRHRREP